MSNNDYQKFVQCKTFAPGGIFMAPADDQLPWGSIVTGVTLAKGNTYHTVYELQWRDRLIVLFRFPNRHYADVLREGQPWTNYDVPAYLVAIVKEEDNRIYMVDDSLTDKVRETLVMESVDPESNDVGDIVATAIFISGGRWDLPLLNIWIDR